MHTVCCPRGLLGRVPTVVVALAAVSLSSVPSAAQEVSRRELTRHGVRASGTVKERGTEAPVDQATVMLRELGAARPAASAETNQDGEFSLDPVMPGSYVIEVTRIGYTSLADTIQLAEGPPATLSAYLTPEAIDLDPMVVTVDQNANTVMAGFERRRAQGIGTFISRADIERRRPTNVTDLFRSVPSVHVRTIPSTGDGMVTMRGGCVPQLIIDGTPVAAELSLDMTMNPSDIEGIEVYGLAGAPIEYSHSQCGTIMVWTRVPRHVAGRGHPWKLLAFVAGIMGALIIIH